MVDISANIMPPNIQSSSKNGNELCKQCLPSLIRNITASRLKIAWNYSDKNQTGLLKKRIQLIHWVTHICVTNLRHHWWFRKWFVACSAPSHYLNQCRITVNWPFGSKLQSNCIWKSNIFSQENAFPMYRLKMSAILSQPQPQCVHSFKGKICLITKNYHRRKRRAVSVISPWQVDSFQRLQWQCGCHSDRFPLIDYIQTSTYFTCANLQKYRWKIYSCN